MNWSIFEQPNEIAFINSMIFKSSISSICALPDGMTSSPRSLVDITFLNPGRYAVGFKDGTIKIVSMEGQVVLELNGHTKGITALSPYANNQLISGSWDGTAKVWN